MPHDAVVVGGSFAGLSAAIYLARARRSVVVLDTRLPRNRYAKASHGFLGQDGKDPLAIVDTARAQLLAYPSVTLIEREAVGAEATDDGFAVTLANGTALETRKLILAFGLRDTLPDIPGVRERWGGTVLHCPYCHGIEFADRQLGVLYSLPLSVHQALLIAEWGPTTLFLNGAELAPEAHATLAARGVRIEPAPVEALCGPDGDLSGVLLADGRTAPIDALYLAPRSVLASPLAERLGVAIDEGAVGLIIRTDADRMTTLPGLYAAGDIARAPHSVSWAVADGVTAGTSAHRALVFG